MNTNRLDAVKIEKSWSLLKLRPTPSEPEPMPEADLVEEWKGGAVFLSLRSTGEQMAVRFEPNGGPDAFYVREDILTTPNGATWAKKVDEWICVRWNAGQDAEEKTLHCHPLTLRNLYERQGVALRPSGGYRVASMGGDDVSEFIFDDGLRFLGYLEGVWRPLAVSVPGQGQWARDDVWELKGGVIWVPYINLWLRALGFRYDAMTPYDGVRKCTAAQLQASWDYWFTGQREGLNTASMPLPPRPRRARKLTGF